jgi:hypothetical protein
MLRRVASLLALVIACGSTQRTSAPTTSCDVVAQHLVELAERDNRDTASSSLESGVRNESTRQCRETPWTEERRRCLVAAATQEDTLACPSK